MDRAGEIPVGFYGEFERKRKTASLRGLLATLSRRRGQIIIGAASAVSAVGIASLFLLGSSQWYGAQNRAEASSFSKRITGELSGKTPLAPDERLVARVKVVPAGRSLFEAAEMDRSRTPVNVRNYPGTNFSNGADTKIIGKVAIGTEISSVILTSGTQPLNPDQESQWGAFYCDSIRNWIELAKEPKPGEVCVISADYLQTIHN